MATKPKSVDFLIVLRKFAILAFLHPCVKQEFSLVLRRRKRRRRKRHPFVMIPLSQLLRNSFPSFGPLVMIPEPLESQTTFIQRILSRKGYQAYQEEQADLLCNLLEHINALKILYIISFVIRLTAKK
jgi:hypothetical protein